MRIERDLAYLKERLRGPILKIKDPADHSTEEILKSYFREILLLAKKYTRPTVPYEDLVVEGIMGLLDAIKRWDPEKANANPRAFHNLAIVRIKSNMFEFFLANSTMYTIPNYMARTMALIDQLRNLIESYEYAGDTTFTLLHYEDPTFEKAVPEDYARRVRALKDKIWGIGKGSGKSYGEVVQTVLRIQEKIESYEQREDYEVSPEEIIAGHEYLDKILTNLKPDTRDVILSLLEGDTLEQAGQKKGFTRERARQIREDTLSYLQRTRIYKDAVE